jgi:hypothetical protein
VFTPESVCVPPLISMPPPPAITPENSVEPAVITRLLLPSETEPEPASVVIGLKDVDEPEMSNVPFAVTTLDEEMLPPFPSASVAPELIVVEPV